MDTDHNITLLIVDDEVAIRNGLSTVVPWEQFGITVVGMAEDGAEAYEIILQYQPDIVITDIRMPDMDGLELMEKVKTKNIDTRFIILSGYGDFKYAQKALQLGAKNYFLKPIKIDELVAEIRQQKTEILRSGHVNSYSTYLNVKSEPKERFLKRLLKHEFYSFEEIEGEIARLELCLNDSSYRVMIFSFGPGEETEHNDEFNQMNNLVDIVGKEMGMERYEFLIMDSRELITIVHTVQVDGNSVDFKFLANKCIRRMKRDFIMDLTIGIGSEGTGLVECAASYKVALQCLSYRFYEKPTEVFDETVLCMIPPATAANHVDYQNLIYYITSSQEDKVREFCQQYFATLLYVPMPPPNYIRGMCSYLVTNIWKELGDRLGEEREFSQTEILLQVNTIHTWTGLKDYLTDFLVECAGRMTDTRGIGSENRMILDAEYYIKSHMGEKILAKHVAAYVNLSDVYFTSCFKLKTGVNFRDYVIRIKMERAKEMLKYNPELPVAEVAASVGYDDYRSFYRVFKQYTGVTPSDYGKQIDGGRDKC